MASAVETINHKTTGHPSMRWFNALIVLATVGLVVGPIFMPALKRERAKWQLAAAMNAVEIGAGSLEENLEKASSELGDLQQQHDFWVFLTKQALEEDFEQVPSVIREAKEHDDAYEELAGYALGRLSLKNNYMSAATIVEIHEVVLSKTQREDPRIQNDLAYLRALVAEDLDLALKDIDSALESYPDDINLRDTRAWVLYKMGRPLEALEDADFAVENFEERVEEQEKFEESVVGLFFAFLETFVAPSTEGSEVLNRYEAGNVLWTQGVLRYHRMRILEDLGRIEESHADLDWLVKKRLPTDSRIHWQ